LFNSFSDSVATLRKIMERWLIRAQDHQLPRSRFLIELAIPISCFYLLPGWSRKNAFG
jgi:hypothetical protein